MPTSILSPKVPAVFEPARLSQVKRVAIGNTIVEITMPFPSLEDWRNKWIYYPSVDRFDNPKSPPQDSLSRRLHAQTFWHHIKAECMAIGGTYDGC